MNTTRKAFALAALIVVTGVAGVELSHSAAQAGTAYAPEYAVKRIDAAFNVAANMPAVEPVSVPMAQKGDLPIPLGCLWMSPEDQSECMDVAYEVPSVPSIVVETRDGNTTTLLRMDAMTVADFTAQQHRSE